MCTIFGVNLTAAIDFKKCAFFYFELSIDRIDKKRQLSFSMGINICGTFHLPLRQRNPHRREYGSGFC